MADRIALYGGSFNPIHFGHLIVARSIAEQLMVDRLIFLPAAQPPHKIGAHLLDGSHRAEMIRLAIEGEPHFELSEHELQRAGTSYTIETVAHFRETLGLDISLYWIIGVDSLNELNTWHRVRILVDACRIITARRPGWERVDFDALRPKLTDEQIGVLESGILDTPRIEMSSSDIRGRIRQNKSIRYLVPDAVADYIRRHGLYQPEKLPG